MPEHQFIPEVCDYITFIFFFVANMIKGHVITLSLLKIGLVRKIGLFCEKNSS